MKPCKIFTSFYPFLISEAGRNILRFWPSQRRNRNPCKYIEEYQQMWKWMVEFLKNFHDRGIKIARVNSILIAKLSIFFYILLAFASWMTSSWAIVFFTLSLHSSLSFFNEKVAFLCNRFINEFTVSILMKVVSILVKAVSIFVKVVRILKEAVSILVKAVSILVKVASVLMKAVSTLVKAVSILVKSIIISVKAVSILI